MTPPLAKRPVDELRSMAAPHELIEWVRKLAPDTAARSAWVDAPRADWLPYLAVMRGISREAILKAICECAVEVGGTVDGADRAMAVLRDGASRGRDAFLSAETDLADLRATIVEQRGKAAVLAPWMTWVELVLELARANGRGNPLVGFALALKTMAGLRSRPGGRPGHTDLVARLRDKLTLAM